MRTVAGLISLVVLSACNTSSSSSGTAPSTQVATASAAPPTGATSAHEPVAARPSGKFSGPPDMTVKLQSAVPAKIGNLMIQAPLGWTLITATDLGWQLITPDHKVQLQIEEVDAGSALPEPKDGTFIGYVLKNVKAAPPAPTTIGKFALPANAGAATARIDNQKEDGQVYFFQLQTGGKRDVRGIALLRAGTTPEQEQGLVAAIRSLRRETDK